MVAVDVLDDGGDGVVASVGVGDQLEPCSVVVVVAAEDRVDHGGGVPVVEGVLELLGLGRQERAGVLDVQLPGRALRGVVHHAHGILLAGGNEDRIDP